MLRRVQRCRGDEGSVMVEFSVALAAIAVASMAILSVVSAASDALRNQPESAAFAAADRAAQAWADTASRMQRIDNCEQPHSGVVTRAGCSRTQMDQTGTAPHLLYSGGSNSEWCVLTRPGSADISRLHPRILECWSVDEARGMLIVTESAPEATIADQFRPFGASNPGTVLSVRLVTENIASARFDCVTTSGGTGQPRSLAALEAGWATLPANGCASSPPAAGFDDTAEIEAALLTVCVVGDETPCSQPRMARFGAAP
ncbi:MAG: hypothetical protein F4Z31_01795 [Gemmatimonadetes bacterium]|nr:hypothetical protein [Gemmatimonadota bacterium]